MPSHSTDTTSSLRDRATAPRNVAIYVAILVAVPVAYGFHVAFGADQADFLLLMTLAVGVPTAYNNYWPAHDRIWKAVGWVLVACALATAVFTGLYLGGRDLLGLGQFPASIGAFVVTFLGVHGVGYLWHGREEN